MGRKQKRQEGKGAEKIVNLGEWATGGEKSLVTHGGGAVSQQFQKQKSTPHLGGGKGTGGRG